MKLGYLILNLLLVGTGIFVYDALRGDGSRHAPVPPAAETPTEVVRERPNDAGQPPLLVGAGFDDLTRRVAALEEALAAAKAGSPRVGVVPADRSTRDDGSPAAPAGSEDPGFTIPDVGDPERPSYDPRTLSQFRAYMDEVQRIRDEERRVDRAKNQITRLGVTLPPDQERGVVEAILAREKRIGDAMRALGGRQGTTREDREAAWKEVNAQFEREVNAIASSSDAQKIVEGLGRFPGGGGRRTERMNDGARGDGR